ncbi:MAG TPA: ABC transporter ATP-binding protein [Candidatus Limnocylindria bacterium]|nr:ABC transporter ATP-binding protein [Candidatus Limnocylindria bacterium]
MIEIKSLTKIYEDGANAGVTAVNDISFTVEEGRFYTLLGPSGCGKTTTLRCIAGLEKANGGEIVVAGQKVYSASDGTFVPAYRRPIGMVFQSYAIWPHMTVFENVAFPLRVGKERFNGADVKKKVETALGQVELNGYEDRMATQLSGGQQQRLALARALVREPKVLLLDEPLSNLDAKLRERMRFELRELQRRLRITTLYVTHDQIEALSMSNVIAVMNTGVIAQEGAPRDIYLHPKSQFVANFIGSTNQMAGEIKKLDADEVAVVKTDEGEIKCQALGGLTVGSKVIVVIRPEGVILHLKRPADDANLLEGKIGAAMFLGEYVECTVELGKNVLETHQRYTLQVRRGDPVWVELPATECMALPAEQ